MNILGIDIPGIIGMLTNNPIETLLSVGVFIVGLPVFSMLLDQLTQKISDVMVKANKLLIDKIPISGIKNWLQEEQVKMLKKSIETYENAINEIELN
jgi:hypothetical protein